MCLLRKNKLMLLLRNGIGGGITGRHQSGAVQRVEQKDKTRQRANSRYDADLEISQRSAGCSSTNTLLSMRLGDRPPGEHIEGERRATFIGCEQFGRVVRSGFR